MNILVKRSAVNRYAALHTEGKSEADVKAALAADGKGFTPAEVDEIYADIVAQGGQTPGSGDANSGDDQNSGSGDQNPGDSGGDNTNAGDTGGGNPNPGAGGDAGSGDNTPDPGAGAKYLVKGEFRDIADFSKVYKAGDDVSHLEAGRLARLVEIGLVEKQ